MKEKEEMRFIPPYPLKEIKDKLKDFDEITLLRKQTWNVVFHIQSELKW